MKHAIEHLKDLVALVGRFPEETGNHFNKELQADWLARAKREIKNIKTFLLRLPQDVKNEKEMRVVIHHYQGEVRYMVDYLYGNSRKKKANTKRLLQPIITELKNLLLHLLEHYQVYFNKADKVSDVYREETIVHLINNRFKTIKGRLEKADPALVQLIGECMQPGKTFSYNDLDYAEKLLSGLEQLTEGAGTGELLLKLVELNFNCSSFISYLVKRISKGIPGEGSFQDKKDYLYKERKNIREVFSDAGVGMMPANEPVKENVCKWIEQEIESLEKREQRANEIGNPGEDDEPFAELAAGKKIPIHLSVDQLAILVRAIWDVGVVGASLSHLFRLLSKRCRTNNAEGFSAESARNKAYGPTRAAKEALVDFLHKLIKVILSY
jgi:hypothetical protein